MNIKDNTIKINKIMLICIILLFCAIIGKLIYINLSSKVDNTNLATFAKNRNTTTKTLYATRGNIYDSTGELLAKDVNSYTLVAFLEPSRTTNPANPLHVVDKQMTAEALAPILDMSIEDILKYLNKTKSDGKPYYQVEFSSKGSGLTERTKKEIEKLSLPGIGFLSSTKRWYKNNDFASYLIGYAKKNDNGEIVGEMGVEKYFNKELKGKDGYSTYEKDIYGYRIPNTPEQTEEPEIGSDIYLTLNNQIQLAVEKMIKSFADKYPMEWMTISIADAKTGAILASGSNPSYSPNDLNTLDSYLNPLVEYQYEPGSTMKIFTFMAAMENEKYKGDEKYASGSTTIGEYTISDFNNVGWGTITYDEGFAYSSNIAAVNLSKKLGKVALREYFEKLGFGAKTGIELPNEVEGMVDFNYDVEVATAAFGQGKMITTPIQNIQALTAIANNGVMLKPYIVDKIIDGDGTVTHQGQRVELSTVASTETINKIKELMYEVVYSDKTTAKYFKPQNTTLIGKTGTAQIPDPKGGYMKGEYEYIRSFTGLFPKEDPEYIIYFSVKRFVGPYKELGNAVAEIIDTVAKKDTTINENISRVDESKIFKIENYLNKNVEEIMNILIEKELVPIVIGSGDTIVKQYPNKNNKVIIGTKVFLLTNNKEYYMPDVIGWSANEIITFCNMIGLKYKIEGYGKVVSTSLEKNSSIDLNQILNIELK